MNIIISDLFIIATPSQVTFELGDITKIELEKNSYDVLYSRDTILHIPDKEGLYKTFLVSSHTPVPSKMFHCYLMTCICSIGESVAINRCVLADMAETRRHSVCH